MSKVNTLLKLIAYQRQHPQASDEEIAQEIGISSRHVVRCRKEVNLLQHQLTEPYLQPGQIQFLMSLLQEHAPDQKEITQQLQKQMGGFYTGTLRTRHPNEAVPVSRLEIGEFIPVETDSSDRLHSVLNLWLQNLCYDPLLVYHRNGEIEGRLVIACEAVKGYSEWQLTLREDLRWSDGKPITLEEVIAAFSASRIAPIITEIKPEGKTQLRVQLSQGEPLFQLHLRGICPFPSHSPRPYRVTSGPYQLKRFRPDATTFRFTQNPDHYRGGDSCIDWLTLKRFTHPPNAVNALEDGTLDLLSVSPRALRSFYESPTTVPCQQWPFFEDNYYVLFLNRHRGPLSDERNCNLLKEAIDYGAINLYLRMESVTEETKSLQPPRLPFDLQIACADGVFHYLAQLIRKSTGASVVNSISIKGEMWEEADAFLTQIFFGFGYSYLAQFFHSEGIHNFFGYANPQVDEMLFQLNQTGDPVARRRIGQQVLSLLQEDFAVISLAPCFQYTFSPLEIQFDDNLTDMIDLVQNMSQLTVERH
jgi:ABC-type transport system substrate-binding protein